MPIFTVITPTYNRGSCLSDVYNSLVRQTYKDFEWLIVDDGSTDDTADIVNAFIERCEINIRYFYQENSGQHIAFNFGVYNACGKYIVDLDSDDELLDDALETLIGAWLELSEDRRCQLSGVYGLCAGSDGVHIGDIFPQDFSVDNLIRLRWSEKIKGDKRGFYRRDVLLKYPFPEEFRFETKFIPERIVWFRIAKEYNQLFINNKVYKYLEHGEVSHNHLSKMKLPASAPETFLLCENAILEHMAWFPKAPSYFLRCMANFTRARLHLKVPFGSSAKKYPVFSKVVFIMGAPVGAALYLKDIRQ